MQSYKNEPNYQRKGGDYILWQLPKSENNIAMFASGLGDGFYHALWGFDSSGEVCELVIPFMNAELYQ